MNPQQRTLEEHFITKVTSINTPMQLYQVIHQLTYLLKVFTTVVTGTKYSNVMVRTLPVITVLMIAQQIQYMTRKTIQTLNLKMRLMLNLNQLF